MYYFFILENNYADFFSAPKIKGAAPNYFYKNTVHIIETGESVHNTRKTELFH